MFYYADCPVYALQEHGEQESRDASRNAEGKVGQRSIAENHLFPSTEQLLPILCISFKGELIYIYIISNLFGKFSRHGRQSFSSRLTISHCDRLVFV